MTDLHAIDAARRALGRQLAAQRKAVGYSQAELGDRVGYSRSSVANVETGRQHTPSDFWQRCDALLGTDGELAATADDIEAKLCQHRQLIAARAQARREAKVRELSAARTAEPASALTPGVPESPTEPDGHRPEAMPRHNLDFSSPFDPAEEDDVERRVLLQLVATLGASTAIPVDALERLRSGLDSSIRPHIALEGWERIAWEYGYTVVGQPPERVVADLAVDICEVRRLFDRTNAPLVRAGLMRVTAQLSAWMAEELHSLGTFGPSWRWWRTARTAADESKDRDLRVWVRAREAINAFHSVRPAASVLALADEAVRIAGGAPSRGLAEAHKNRAYAFMRQGDEESARAALGDMRRAFEGLPSQVASDTDSLWDWPERIMYVADSHVYTTFGTPEAAPAQERALALYPAHWRTEVTRLKLFQAISLIRGGDIGSGLAHALASIECLPEGHRHRPSIARAADQVLDVLPDDRARNMPPARELQAITGWQPVPTK